ncbi:MAG: condensation domain-containing protein, partial [Chitinophagaceae bacterium]
MQKIISRKETGFKIKEIKLTGTDKETKAKEIAGQEGVTPFDLAKGPLLRVTLIETEKNKHIVLFTMHHIIADGWSANIIIHEILALYDAYQEGQPDPLSPLKIQYKDYAAWQEQQLTGEKLQLHRDYWLDRLSKNIPVLQLPSDKARPPVQTFNGDVVNFSIDNGLTEKIAGLNRTLGSTIYMILLASLKALLYKYSGQTDMIIGSPSAGRDDSDLENQIGFYINTLALRTTFKPDNTFSELLSQVKEVTLSAYQHQVYPLERVIEELKLERDMSRSALFDIIMILHNMPMGPEQSHYELKDIEVTPFAKEHKVSQRDLTFNFQEINGQIDGSIEYNTDIFSKRWIEILIDQYKNILHQITGNPEQQLQLYNIPIENIKEQSNVIHATAKLFADEFPADKEQAIYIAPRNETEKRVVEIIGQVLASNRPVSMTDNFFAIGGHSLKAMRLIYKLNKEMNTKIGLATIYLHPTIEKLAEAISQSTIENKPGGVIINKKISHLPKAKDANILPLKKQDYYDITYSQLNFLTENQLVEDNVSGRIPLGAINEEAYIKTWEALIERHESFRTVFLFANGAWKQKILPSSDPIFKLEVIDLRKENNAHEIANEIEEKIINKPYDFTNGPLIIRKLIRLSNDQYELIFTVSHAIADGWTLHILKKDMDLLYEAFVNKRPNPLKPLPVQVKEYAAWHNKLLRHKDAIHDKTYWHNKLKGKLPKLKLPVDYPDGYSDIGRYAIY